MRRSITKFTDEQCDFIRKNYQKMMAKDIASELGLTTAQVIGWANNHGVRKGRSRLFSDDELEYIEANYLIMTYQEIADKLGYTERQVCGWINNNLPRKVRTFNDRYFQNITTPNQAYWLGFIYADGWISGHMCRCNTKGDRGPRVYERICYEFGMELQREDEYILQRLNEELGGVHKIYRKHKELYICGNKNKTVTETSVLRVYSNPLVMDLMNNGIDLNKTNTSNFPIVPDHLFMDFLRGYIDGDGCIHEMKPGVLAVHITGANKSILEFIQGVLLERYDIHSSLYMENERKHRLYCFRAADVRKLLDLIYHDPDCLKLNRKYEKYINFYGLAA